MVWSRLEGSRWYYLFDQGQTQAGSIAWHPIDKRAGLGEGFGLMSGAIVTHYCMGILEMEMHRLLHNFRL